MGANGCEYEIETIHSRYIDYIYAEGKIVALHVHNTTANADSIYYVQTDLLGSRERIVDGNRYVVQSCLFDPWGNRMSASDWTVSQDGSDFAFRRGFTGHEHYDRFGIINMNARLYDPVLGRFFSPDPQVQSPFSTQGFNRYSYCGNNPVMYVDEDGELAWFIPLNGGWTSALTGGIMGSIAGGTSAYAYATRHNINPWTGTSRNGVMIGEGMDRVDLLSRDMNVGTIDKDWPQGMEAYDRYGGKANRIFNSDAMDFNSQWIEIQMEQELVIYDIGPYNGSIITSPFYNMEVGRTMCYSNIQHVYIIILREHLRIVAY